MAAPTSLRVFSIRNLERDGLLATRARLYSSMWLRFAGLMLRKGLAEGDGILLTHSGSVHGFFMRFRFDAVFIDDDGRVTKVVQAMRPWTIAFGGKGGKHTIELPAGTAERTGTVTGDRLAFQAPMSD